MGPYHHFVGCVWYSKFYLKQHPHQRQQLTNIGEMRASMIPMSFLQRYFNSDKSMFPELIVGRWSFSCFLDSFVIRYAWHRRNIDLKFEGHAYILCSVAWVEWVRYCVREYLLFHSCFLHTVTCKGRWPV